MHIGGMFACVHFRVNVSWWEISFFGFWCSCAIYCKKLEMFQFGLRRVNGLSPLHFSYSLWYEQICKRSWVIPTPHIVTYCYWSYGYFANCVRINWIMTWKFICLSLFRTISDFTILSLMNNFFTCFHWLTVTIVLRW